MKKILLSTLILLVGLSSSMAGDPIKIMPLGNSITAGEHYGQPSTPEREGFRKPLYEMLIDTGYNVDFVGSQPHGTRPECTPDWYDWNSETYPGRDIAYISSQLALALPKYEPDIILSHVGTNNRNWDEKPGEVVDMLDLIDQYSVDNDHPITVFLCLIINRYLGTDTATTEFNQRVADTVATRTGDKIKIIVVDMENGAGLDYTDSLPDPDAIPPYEGGDMWGYRYPGVTFDLYHPNDKGNLKMALKYYEELVKELPEPEKIDGNMVAGLRVIGTSTGFVKVNWEANYSDEEGYVLERASGAEAFALLDTVPANTRCKIDSSSDAASEYMYRIKAFNAGGESPYSSEISYLPKLDSILFAVTNDNHLELSWEDNFLTEEGFVVERLGDDGYELVDSLAASTVSLIDTEADPLDEQRYRIRAYNATGEGAWYAESYYPPSYTETNALDGRTKVYPNPFRDEVNFELNILARSVVDIKIIDLNGAVIANVINQTYDPGLHTIAWKLDEGGNRNLQTGFYFCKIKIGNDEVVQKLTLIK